MTIGSRIVTISIIVWAAMVVTGCGGGGSASNSSGGTGGGGSTGGGGGSSSAPTLTRISPSGAMVGVPQGIITLMGANLTSTSTVLFDGLVANSFFRDSSSIQVQL